MTWFRLYHEFITDQKVIDLSPKTQLFLVKIWCVSSRQTDRGTLPKIDLIAKMIGTTKGKTSVMIRELIAAGFIDEDVETKALTIHAWETRQYDSDDAAKRKRDQRSRDMSRDKGRDSHAQVTAYQSTEYRGTEIREENTPLTPKGDGVVTQPKMDGSTFAPSLPAQPAFDPAAQKVAKIAEDLFPMREFGRKAADACKQFGPAIVERALRDAHAQELKTERRNHWPYVQGIMRRVEKDLTSPLPAPAGAKSTVIEEWEITRAPVDSIFYKMANR